MKKQCLFVLLVMVALLVSILPTQASADSTKELVFVSILPMSGPVSFIGLLPSAGQQLAADDINAAGGVKIGKENYKLKLITYDDKADPRETMIAANRAITHDKANAICGLVMTSSAPPVADLCAQKKVINVSSVSTAIKFIGPNHPYSFRITGDNETMTSAVARFVAEKLKAKSFVQLCMMEEWGHTAASMFRKKLPMLGVKFIEPIYYSWGTSDFHTQLDKIKALKPDVIFCQIFVSNDQLIIIRQLKEMGITCPIIFSDGLTEEAYLTGQTKKDTLALAAIQPIFSYYHESAASRDPNGRNKHLAEKYRAKYKSTIDHFGRNGYDEIMMIAKGFELAGSTDPDQVRSAMLAMNYKAAAYDEGKFFPNGQIHFTEYIVQLNPNGTHKYIAAYPLKWDKVNKRTYIDPF